MKLYVARDKEYGHVGPYVLCPKKMALMEGGYWDHKYAEDMLDERMMKLIRKLKLKKGEQKLVELTMTEVVDNG